MKNKEYEKPPSKVCYPEKDSDASEYVRVDGPTHWNILYLRQGNTNLFMVFPKLGGILLG